MSRWPSIGSTSWHGTYKLDVAVHRARRRASTTTTVADAFRVTSRVKDIGIFRPPHRWSFSGGDRASAAPHRRRPVTASARQAGVAERGRGNVARAMSRAAAAPSCSPTACSTCCTRATCATCRRPARLGDALIVGVNSDRRCARNKGHERPVNPERARRVLLALGCVDAVVVFDEETPHAIITPFSRTCSSKAPTGARTTSSAATSSRRAAAAWSASCEALQHRAHRRSGLRASAPGLECAGASVGNRCRARGACDNGLFTARHCERRGRWASPCTRHDDRGPSLTLRALFSRAALAPALDQLRARDRRA